MNPVSTQIVFVLGIALTQEQNLVLGLELYEVGNGPPLKPVDVPQDGIPSLLSTTPYSLVSVANLLRLHSVPLFTSITLTVSEGFPGPLIIFEEKVPFNFFYTISS